jgi:hypothetical protein
MAASAHESNIITLLFLAISLFTIMTWIAKCHAFDIVRDYHGDIFTLPSDVCSKSACNQSDRLAAPISSQECKCQCAPSHQVFREDLRICINDINGMF